MEVFFSLNRSLKDAHIFIKLQQNDFDFDGWANSLVIKFTFTDCCILAPPSVNKRQQIWQFKPHAFFLLFTRAIYAFNLQVEEKGKKFAWSNPGLFACSLHACVGFLNFVKSCSSTNKITIKATEDKSHLLLPLKIRCPAEPMNEKRPVENPTTGFHGRKTTKKPNLWWENKARCFSFEKKKKN